MRLATAAIRRLSLAKKNKKGTNSKNLTKNSKNLGNNSKNLKKHNKNLKNILGKTRKSYEKLQKIKKHTEK